MSVNVISLPFEIRKGNRRKEAFLKNRCVPVSLPPETCSTSGVFFIQIKLIIRIGHLQLLPLTTQYMGIILIIALMSLGRVQIPPRFTFNLSS